MPTFSYKYTAEQYGKFLMNLLPPGPAFTRIPNTSTWKMMSALALELNRLDTQINALIKEAYPQLTTDLIENWETEIGLPGFFTIPAAMQDRRNLIEFLMIGVSDFHIDHGLAERFWRDLAESPFLDYVISSFTYFERLAVGPQSKGNTTGDSTALSDTIMAVGDVSIFTVGDFVVMSKGFPNEKIQVTEKGFGYIKVDIPAVESTTGLTIYLYDEYPAACGDPVGEAWVNAFAIMIALPASILAYAPDGCCLTEGSNVVTMFESTAGAIIGDYMLFPSGFEKPYQKILSKTVDTLTVENAATSTVGPLIAIQKTKGGELIEGFFNQLKPSHNKIIFNYS